MTLKPDFDACKPGKLGKLEEEEEEEEEDKNRPAAPESHLIQFNFTLSSIVIGDELRQL